LIAERYVILEQLGAGAMGTVHLAHQVWLDRMVAIKVLRTGDPVTPRARRRLHREARAVARISHPNVVQVHDYGETYDARPFLVMERIDGPTARVWYRESSPSLGEILDATGAALAGLAAAHAAGVLHRDLKPANMLLRDGDPSQLVLVDFGIAAVLRGPDAGAASVVDLDEELPATIDEDRESLLTRPGTVMGTPLYMSPEQALGQVVGAESDVYGMGVILYEWLHGRPPFEGPVREVMFAHVHRTLPEGPALFDLPSGLRKLLRRALAKDPAKRYPDAAAMYRALKRLPAVGVSDLRASGPVPHRKAPATIPVSGLAADAAPALPGELPFAAREADFMRLFGLLQPSGLRGRIVLVRGVAGVGKTRLVREVVEAVARTGAARVGTGVARSDAAPYAEIVAALTELDGAALDPPGGDETSRAPLGDIGDGLERRARAAAGDLPAVLRIEDLEQAGAATFAFLERLAGAQLLDPFPLIVVATLEAGAGGEVTRSGLSRLSRHAGDVVEFMDLSRLTDAGVEELLSAALPLTEEAARRLAAPCGGSPLLATQLLRHVVRSGVLRASDSGWDLPDDALRELGPAASVDQLLRYRLAGLCDGPEAEVTTAVIEAAAVLGDRFDVELLEVVLEVGGRVLDADTLDAVLDRLLAEGALAEVPGSGDRLRWDSGLLRGLVLGDMQGSRRRRRLSAAAARALIDVPGSERAVVELFLVAGDPVSAAPFAVNAGEAAVEAGEWNDALRLLTTALSTGTLERATHTRALFAMAEADNALGRREEAEARFEEALTHAGSALERARAWFGMGRSRFNRGLPHEAVESLSMALLVLEGQAGRRASRLRNRMVRTLAAAAQAAPGGALGQVQVEPPGDSDGPRERLEYFKTVGYLALLRGDPTAAAQAFTEALAEARAAGAEADEPRILCDLGAAYRRANRVQEARRVLHEALAAARRVRMRPLEAKLLNELGELARETGSPADAREHYARAVAIWEARGDHHAFLGRLNLALTDAESGDAQGGLDALEALADAEGGVPERWRVPFALTAAFAAAAAGHHARAELDLEDALTSLRRAGVDPPEARAMMSRLQKLWASVGEEERADRVGRVLSEARGGP
jgi:tetratricopeptide (TPR) repeat protein